MNNEIGKNIRKYREIKGYSQEYMAHELNINQASYAKLENNSTKITIDRLFNISKLLQTDITDLLELNKQHIYNLYENQHAVGHQQVENLYQENKEVYERLIKSKDDQIELLKEQINFYKKNNIS